LDSLAGKLKTFSYIYVLDHFCIMAQQTLAYTQTWNLFVALLSFYCH